MIEGEVTSDGVPQIVLHVAGRDWAAIVDTGFNGDLQLPDDVRDELDLVWVGPITSELASGQEIVQDAFETMFPFDGEDAAVCVAFMNQPRVLVGTRLLRKHRLEMDFPASTVRIERSQSTTN
jgi:predicted aspartyl protease